MRHRLPPTWTASPARGGVKVSADCADRVGTHGDGLAFADACGRVHPYRAKRIESNRIEEQDGAVRAMTMDAWVVEKFGEPHVFRQRRLPAAAVTADHEVLIRVAGSSINPLDYKIRSGALGALCPPKPAILHGDCAGIVEAVGAGVSRFNPGDEVYGCIGGVGALQGATADLAVADHRLLAHRPRSIPLVDAAALPLAAITAVEGLDKAGLRPGERVLVHGGTGGVGHLALQIARARGAQVWATVGSSVKADLARELGAVDAVLYRDEEVARYVDRLTAGMGFDLVFDTVGGSNIERSIDATRLNGRMVTIQARGDHDLGHAHMRAVSIHIVLMLIPLDRKSVV